jgi:hypothetical protein
MALLLQKVTPRRLAAPQYAAAAQLLPEAQVVQAAQPGPLASRRLPAQSRDAQQALVAEEPKPKPAEQAVSRVRPVWPAEPRLLTSAEPPAPQDAAAVVARPQLPASA